MPEMLIDRRQITTLIHYTHDQERSMEYQPQPGFLNNRTILVTGASEGIGRQAALSYAQFGARVFLLGRTLSKLQAVQQEIAETGGVPAEIFTFDLISCQEADYQHLAECISEKTTCLDGVLHSAGLLSAITPLANTKVNDWLDLMQVNVTGAFILTRYLLPLMLRAPSASLVFTSSSVGRKGRSGWGAYSVSKFATEGMMQVLAEEHQHTSLRVNCINPGGTRTAMRASAFPQEDPQKLKTPAEIMPVYLYLMGDDSRQQNGISFDAQPGRKPGIAQ